MTDAPLSAIHKGTGMEKCGTKPRTAQRGVERSGVTTAGNGVGSEPRSVEQDGKDGQAMRPMDAGPC